MIILGIVLIILAAIPARICWETWKSEGGASIPGAAFLFGAVLLFALGSAAILCGLGVPIGGGHA